jgi:hypothetical protein
MLPESPGPALAVLVGRPFISGRMHLLGLLDSDETVCFLIAGDPPAGSKQTDRSPAGRRSTENGMGGWDGWAGAVPETSRVCRHATILCRKGIACLIELA